MKVVSYLTAPLPGELDERRPLRIVLGAFAATAASVALIHQFLPGGDQPLAVLTHSVAIATVYTTAILIVGGVAWIATQRARPHSIAVWQIWILSFLIFNVGYFLDLPIADGARGSLHRGESGGGGWFHYARLVPIWALMTYAFVEARARSRRAPPGEPSGPSHGAATLELVSGKKTLRLDAGRVSHIEVEDHYCYLHFDGRTGWRRIEVALPLRELLEIVPDSFVAIHRSHVVNLAHADRVERDGRNHRLVLTNGTVLAISRHRARDVLPRIRAYLESR